MGKDIKKRFTVSLDIETKDVEKQVKATVGNLKTILADLGKASDKMGYFKELVDYIGQIDTALTTLKTKNKDAFDHMFDGLDENLRKQLEGLFGTSGTTLSQLDVLREKMATLTPKSGIKELRSFAKEINTLFDNIGADSPFEDIDKQFAGKANASHIQLLTDALDNFATVWDGVNQKISGGFGTGGAGGGDGSGSDGIVEFSEEIQKQIDELNRQIKELEDVKDRFEQVSKTVKTAQSKGDAAIPESYKTELTIESVQKLIDEFDALKVQLESGDKSSIEYYNNLTRITEVILTLKKALVDIRADDSIKQVFAAAPGGRDGNMIGKLSAYTNSKSSGFLTQVTDLRKNKGIDMSISALLNEIEAIKAKATSDATNADVNVDIDVNKIKNQIDDLEKQVNRLQEIKLLFQDLSDEKMAFDAGEGLSENFEVDKTAESIKQLISSYKTLSEAHKKFVAAGDTSSVDYYSNLSELSKVVLQLQDIDDTMDDTLEKALSGVKSGRGNLLNSFENVAVDIEGFFENTFTSASQSIDKLINDSTTKLQSLQADLQKMQDQMKSQSKTDAGKKTSGAGTGTGSGVGTGSGSGDVITNIDFTSLENTIKSEITSLANKLDNVLKVEVVKNDTADITNAIDGVKSTIEKISASIDNYNALKNTDAKQAEINTMKNNLTQLFKVVSEFNSRKIDNKYQQQEIGAAILSDGSIAASYGEDGTVPWDRMARSLLANLTKSLLVDVHSHPWAQNRSLHQYANDFFSGSSGDLGAFRFSKELGAQMTAMITGNIMRTLDVSKLTDAQMMQFRKALSDIEKTYANTPEYSKYMEYINGKLDYHSQGTLGKQHEVTEAFESLMYKAFESIGYSKDRVDQELFAKYDLTDDAQLTALAERLVDLSQSSQNALSPVERLSEIISHFGGDVNSEKAKVGFDAFEKGELSAAQVFNGLNGQGYKIHPDTLDSLINIDTANEMSAVESLLTQITSILNSIDSNITNIVNNTRQSTSDKFDTSINDILDIREGVNNEHLIAGIKSIFDPLNISEYKNKEVLKIADESVIDATDYIQDLFRKSMSDGSVNIDEMQIALDKFYLAMSNVQDAIKQIDLYETRTKETVTDSNGDIAKYVLNDSYKELTDNNILQQLLYLLSQAKIDIGNNKDFYKNGLSGQQSDLDFDGNQISGLLQSIQSTLDSIYGVLHGFTGIEADTKNSLKYKEPAADTVVNQTGFSEQDLSVLNSILQVLQGIDGYLSTNKLNDTTEQVTQDNNEISELSNFIRSQLSQQLATEDTLQVIKSIIDNLYNQLSQVDSSAGPDDQNVEDQSESDVYQLLVNKLPQNVASEDTMQTIKGAIEQIADLLNVKDASTKDDNSDMVQSLNTLISALTANITTLKDVANGIVQHQKAQRTDTSKAMARIADPKQHQYISDLARGSVSNLGSEVEIKSLQALADGIVKVEGAFKNVNDEWEGFTVKINEHNNAVDLAINKQSAFAKALNNSKNAIDTDDNTYVYNKEEVETRAKKHLEEYAAQGKNATVQFKDSGRYTITILEEIDGLSKQIFQTFDENDDKIERTTVTMSNNQKTKLDNLQKKLIETGLSDGLISDTDGVYKDYQDAANALSNMTNTYSQLDNISDVEIANWKQQIALVQQLGGQVEDLIKQRKLANDQKVFESDRGKKLNKFDLDKATLQKNIAIPDSFNQRMNDARTAIANAADNDSLKIAINNWEALQNEIKKTATEQDLYIKKSKETKNTNTKPDQFTKNLTKQQTAFAQYKKDVQDSAGVTDELKTQLEQLETELSAISDADGLSNWVQSFKNLKVEIANAQKGFKNSQTETSAEIAGKANSKFKELDFKANDNNLSKEQQDIVDKRKELLQQISEYNTKVRSGQEAEIDGIQATRDELYKLIDAYKQAHNIDNAGGSSSKTAYGTKQFNTFTGKYNSLINRASSAGLNTDVEAVKKLTTAYENLKNIQSTFKVGENVDSGDGKKKADEFQRAREACIRYYDELIKVVQAEEEWNNNGIKEDAVAENFTDDENGRMKALTDYVHAQYGARAEIEKFTDACNTAWFTVESGNGTVTKMSASFNNAKTSIRSFAGDVEKTQTKVQKLWSALQGKVSELWIYAISRIGVDEVIQQVKQGVNYVKEIDSALTELKKVTNETDATYNRFLQSMSKTASVVGSTVSELTTMAAD